MQTRGGELKKLKPFLIPILCLVLLDQMIKIIISTAFMQYNINIFGDWVRFKPILNVHLSWGGNYINILSNPVVLVLLNLLVLFIFVSGYLLYKTKRKTISFSVRIIMACGIAGCCCSLLDKLFWGGSLDFIQIPGFFTFDLKDCYLSAAEALLVIIGIMHSKEISAREYFHFCYKKFRV